MLLSRAEQTSKILNPLANATWHSFFFSPKKAIAGPKHKVMCLLGAALDLKGCYES